MGWDGPGNSNPVTGTRATRSARAKTCRIPGDIKGDRPSSADGPSHRGAVLPRRQLHGVGVHRATRVCAAGHGGQILLSSATAGIVRQRSASAGSGARG